MRFRVCCVSHSQNTYKEIFKVYKMIKVNYCIFMNEFSSTYVHLSSTTFIWVRIKF